jgi:mono/diheme cytochrome c family protein
MSLWSRPSNLATLLLLAVSLAGQDPRTQPAAPAPPDPASRGRALYLANCAACHGDRGFGDGPAASLLYPRPRDFSAYHFRLVSTANGVPTDEDLFQAITRGMLGSSMPPHDHMPEADRRELVVELRRLMREEGMKRLLEEAEASGETLPEEVAREVAYRDPGAVLRVPPATPATRESLARGRRLFVLHCASCHDSDGSGRTRTDLLDSAGQPLFARDFTSGILKGGASHEELWRRVRAGMPGTPMPALELPDPDTADLVAYLRSMIPPGAQEQLVQRRTVLRAGRVAEGRNLREAGAWTEVPAVWLPLAPLWWRDPRVEGVMVQALHDGQRLAVRLLWEDATLNEEMVDQRAFSDAAAIQVSLDPDPPFFAMGDSLRECEIWYWRAARLDAAADVGALSAGAVNDVDLSLVPVPAGEQVARGARPISDHDPLFLTGLGAKNPVSDPRLPPLHILRARGFGTLSPLARPVTGPDAVARWDRGGWELVLLRSFDLGPHALRIGPGTSLRVAFAIWDGAAQDRDGKKNVSIWHELVLE